LSNQNISSQTKTISLDQATERFLCNDDISRFSADKKKMIYGKQIRFLLSHLVNVQQRFIVETNYKCSYSTFTRHIPHHIITPKPSDWGTCLCIVCLNPQLKIEKLLQSQSHRLQLVPLSNIITSDLPLIVSDLTKIKQIIDELNNLNTEKFLDLVKHIGGVKSQFRAAKQARIDVVEKNDILTIQLDWSENYNLKQAREERGAYYIEHHISIATGYVWKSND
ncbi:unnamed protein product, partial [Didymodactylos carnosus]